jgi:hypothetical protein
MLFARYRPITAHPVKLLGDYGSDRANSAQAVPLRHDLANRENASRRRIRLLHSYTADGLRVGGSGGDLVSSLTQ